MFRLLVLAVLASAVMISNALADGIGLEGSWQVGTYKATIRNVEDKDTAPEATLTVKRNGKTIYTLKNAVFWLNPAGFFPHSGKMSYDESIKPHWIGEDVLKLGEPTLMVWGFSLGAHCCFDLTILTLGQHFHAMPTLHLYDNEFVDVRSAPEHTALVISASDLTFAYWRASFGGSSAPRVTLSYNAVAGRYEADPELMRAPSPNWAKLKDEAAAAKAAFQDSQDGTRDVPREVTQPVLDLIYGGNMAMALDFLKVAWVGTPEERDDYWRDLTTCQMRLSQFWPAVAKLNRLQPEKPMGHCPKRW